MNVSCGNVAHLAIKEYIRTPKSVHESRIEQTMLLSCRTHAHYPILFNVALLVSAIPEIILVWCAGQWKDAGNRDTFSVTCKHIAEPFVLSAELLYTPSS